MKGRVTWDGRFISTGIDWMKFVDKPAKEGYFVEAFASADALIDSQLQNVLRQVYSSFESQHLINQLISVKEETNFFGAGILEILENSGVIDKKKIGNKIRYFKGERNKVSHNMRAEYSLVSPIPFKTQDEYDLAVESEAKKALVIAFDIFNELAKLNTSLAIRFKEITPKDKANWLIKKEKDF